MLIGWNNFWLHSSVQPQQAVAPLVDKGMDSAVSYAQSLSQWAYITIGASVAVLFKDLAQRPSCRWIRWSFLLFLPGWFLLAWAIYKGTRLHGAYLMYLMGSQHDPYKAIQYINADAASQQWALKWGLLVFIVWLAVYLFWWTFHRDGPRSNDNLNLP